MKCKTCNGLGRTKATEFIGVDEGLRDVVILCPACGGKGEIELTEQEYIQTCNTEQLAEEISHLVFGGDFKKHISKMGYINMHSFKTEIMEWLNQPHNND